jgi:hypothetical protein
MIHLKLIRQKSKKDFTHGEMFVKDSFGKWLDFSQTLEDEVRDINMDGDLEDEGESKVYGKTAIPFSPKDKPYEGFLRMSPKRGRIVPELKEVKHFKNIQIHSGNNVGHSLGCILVGYKTDNDGSIWESTKAEQDLVKLIENNGGEFTLEII